MRFFYTVTPKYRSNPQFISHLLFSFFYYKMSRAMSTTVSNMIFYRIVLYYYSSPHCHLYTPSSSRFSSKGNSKNHSSNPQETIRNHQETLNPQPAPYHNPSHTPPYVTFPKIPSSSANKKHPEEILHCTVTTHVQKPTPPPSIHLGSPD